MTYLYVMIEGMLYGAILLLDGMGAAGSVSNRLKFCAVLLCLFFAAGSLLYDRYAAGRFLPDKAVVSAALFFTCLADSRLLFQGNLTTGLFFFIIVQLLYFYLLQKKIPIKAKKLLFNRVIAGFCICLALFYFSSFTILLAEVVFYVVFFIGNLWILIKWRFDRYRKYKVYGIGMVLFFLCDIQVGLYNLSTYLPMMRQSLLAFEAVSGFLMWFFYLPSQVLITVSAVMEQEDAREAAFLGSEKKF